MGLIAIYYSLKPYIALIFLGLVVLRLATNRLKAGVRDIPGPAAAKFSRLWKLHSVWKGDHHNTAIDLHRKYGPLVRIGPRHVSVGDPSAIPVIYGLNSGFTKVYWFLSGFRYFVLIIATADGLLPHPMYIVG